MFIKVFIGGLVAAFLVALFYTFVLRPSSGESAMVTAEIKDSVTGEGRKTLLPKRASAEETKEAAGRLKASSARWLDVYLLAGNTPRVSLAPVIAEMQKEQRTLKSERMPACLEYAKQELVKAHEYQIDEFMRFLSDTQNPSKTSGFEAANNALENNIAIQRACGVEGI